MPSHPREMQRPGEMEQHSSGAVLTLIWHSGPAATELWFQLSGKLRLEESKIKASLARQLTERLPQNINLEVAGWM